MRIKVSRIPMNKDMFTKNRLKSLAPLILLLAITYMAFSVRMYSANGAYFPDIDTYYLFRMSSTVLTNDFHMPAEDALRYYPTHLSPRDEDTGAYYFYPTSYALLSGAGLVKESFADFSWWFPALLGALSVIPMYLIGKSLHGRLTGLFAAFFFAVTPAILSRNSAWYVEKEVQAALFMLVSLYFFIRALKKSSVMSGIVSGLSLFMMATMWGGVQQLFVGYGVFVLMLLFANKAPSSLYRTYPFVVLLGVLLPTRVIGALRIGDAAVLINVAALGVLAVRYAAERFSLIPKEKVHLAVPALYAAGLVAVFIGGFFSSSIAGLFLTAKNYLFFQHNVIGSTVAENIPPGWGDFENQIGTTYAQGMLPALAPLIKSNIFDVWVLGFLGILILIYRIYEKRDAEFWLAGIASLLVMYSYYTFLSGTEAVKGTFQMIFVASFVALIALVSRKNALGSLVVSLLFVAMLGSMSYIRLFFLVAPFMALLAAYGLSNIIERASSAKIFRPEDGSKINIFSAAGLLVLGLFLFTNFAAASVMGHNMGALYNKNWDDAMKYMKTQTANDSVILSWWDYGYWFQLMGERATNLDGGNGIANRNIPTAQYFTGMMNETEQKYFLQQMGTTHVLVDASMVGKYAAMSKIANYGNKIDSYLQFGSAGSQQNGNITLVAYSANPYSLFVPFGPDGNLAGPVVMSLPEGQAYISSICTDKGIFPLNTPKKENTLEGCVFLGPNYALYASKEVANSVFTKLFFMDGLGLPYVNKVFDDGEVKIYEINSQIPRVPRERLLPWWNAGDNFDGSGLRVYDGQNRISQKTA